MFVYKYILEIEHVMNFDREYVKAENIMNLRKSLIKRYSGGRGWQEVTIVVFKDLAPPKGSKGNPYGDMTDPLYMGTMYIYGEPKHMTYSWSVNPMNNWGNYRHVLGGSVGYAINPKTGKLTKR